MRGAAEKHTLDALWKQLYQEAETEGIPKELAQEFWCEMTNQINAALKHQLTPIFMLLTALIEIDIEEREYIYKDWGKEYWRDQ